MTEMLAAPIRKVLAEWDGPLARLWYIADGGKNEVKFSVGCDAYAHEHRTAAWMWTMPRSESHTVAERRRLTPTNAVTRSYGVCLMAFLNGNIRMWKQVRMLACVVLRYYVVAAAVVAVSGSAVIAEEALGLQEVKRRVEKQIQRIDSLHIRVRRETTISVDPHTASAWFTLPEFLGTDEELFAFKGDRRYWRLLGLDYRPTFPFKPTPKEDDATRLHVDVARACTAETLYERAKYLASRPRQYRTIPVDLARNAFPSPEYLRNVGLATPDPTAKDAAQRDLQVLAHLASALKRWPYSVSIQPQEIDGVQCVVLEGRIELPVSESDGSKKVFIDKLWLDLKHGLAIRKRETLIAGLLTRVLNSDFAEVLPGFWLPRQSTTLTFAPENSAKNYRNRPVMIRQMKLRLWVVNQTPDNLFSLLAERRSPYNVPPAYHWQVMRLTADGTEAHFEEGWIVRGMGRRIEIRSPDKESMLLRVIVDTTRWRFTHDISRGRVTASPSLLEVPSAIDEVHAVHRERIDEWSEMGSALFALEKEQRGNREVDKVTYYFPADPLVGGEWPIHGWVRPKELVDPLNVAFRTRLQWWDPKTGFSLGKECGCKTPKHGVISIDYPDPEGVPKELFRFQVPRDAQLEVDDRALGRRVYSEGTSLSDLQPRN